MHKDSLTGLSAVSNKKLLVITEDYNPARKTTITMCLNTTQVFHVQNQENYLSHCKETLKWPSFTKNKHFPGMAIAKSGKVASSNKDVEKCECSCIIGRRVQ